MILVISRFGFEGWIWVLIASVPDLCIPFPFTSGYIERGHFVTGILEKQRWTHRGGGGGGGGGGLGLTQNIDHMYWIHNLNEGSVLKVINKLWWA